MNFLKTLRKIPVTAYNAETLSYRDRVIANGGSISVATLNAIEKFVQDCKNALLWDKLLEVGPLAGSDLNAAMVKLVYPNGNPGVLTNVNFVSGDYVETGSNGGLNGDGSTKYLNTAFNISTSLPDFGHISFYLREDVVAAGNRALIGGLGGADQYWLGAVNPASASLVRYGQTVFATGQPLTKGFYLGSRVSNSNLRLFKNGALDGTDSTPVTQVKPNTTIFGFAFSSSGAAAAYLPGRGSFYSIGQSMTDSEAAAYHEAVRTLQRNLNRAVN